MSILIFKKFSQTILTVLCTHVCCNKVCFSHIDLHTFLGFLLQVISALKSDKESLECTLHETQGVNATLETRKEQLEGENQELILKKEHLQGKHEILGLSLRILGYRT